MTNEEYWYWLCNIKGIARKKISKLLGVYNRPEIIYSLPESELCNVKGIARNDVQNIINSRKEYNIQKAFEELKNKRIRFISIENKEYPNKLRNIEDKPYGLYVKGKLPILKRKSVAIIGARECSNYGKIVAKEYSKILSLNNIEIISGMARGVDSYAHYGALEAKGNTYAVLGCGANICYPKDNYNLYNSILESGGIISEYPPGTEPRPGLFPERNRIISGLADAILLVEARLKSGSLITVDFALEQGKDVFAIPGRINDALSEGCNNLINQGAVIANNPEEILYNLGIKCEQNNKFIKKYANSLERKENILYSCLDLQPISIDEIFDRVEMEMSEIMTTLIDLELKGFVKETSKNYFVKIDI